LFLQSIDGYYSFINHTPRYFLKNEIKYVRTHHDNESTERLYLHGWLSHISI
ncbi:hypothetical protein ACJX0J_026663, partial [Zea mays]